MSGFVFFKNTDISNSGSSGSIPDPSVYGGRQIAVIKPNTAHLPSSPSDLVKNNYVIVDRNLDDSVFPFTIDSVTFLSKYDSAIYNGRGWELQSGIQNTLSVRVVDKTNESLSGNATTQQEINKENRKELQDLRSRAQILVGYFSSTEPTGAEEEDLWFETSADHDTGDDLPTTFPIQVKEYKNGAWSTTTKDYTPNNNDLWSNLNNRHGFYWFGNSWNLTDAVQPNLDPDDLEWNSANQISYKAHSVNSNVLGTDITDDSTLTQDATTNKIKVKMQGITNNEVLDNTLSFSKVNSNSIANGLENNNQKFVKADDFYDKAIVGSNLQLETTSLGDTNLVLNLNNSIDAPVASQKLLKQGSDYTTLSDTDKLSYLNITTQELKDVALSAVNTYIQSKLTGAISPVLTNNLTANRAVITNASGKLDVANAVTAKTNTNIAGVSYNAQGLITGKGTEYSVQTSMPSSPTDSQLLTAKAIKNIGSTLSITTLWTGTLSSANQTANLSESINNFKLIIIRTKNTTTGNYKGENTSIIMPSITGLNNPIAISVLDGVSNVYNASMEFTSYTTLKVIYMENVNIIGLYGIK